MRKEPGRLHPRRRATLGSHGPRHMGACAENQGEEVQWRVFPKSRGTAARPRRNRGIATGGKLHVERGRSIDLRHAGRTGARPRRTQRLGAHYTPRAYVERLVVATIIEPLREDWRNVQ